MKRHHLAQLVALVTIALSYVAGVGAALESTGCSAAQQQTARNDGVLAVQIADSATCAGFLLRLSATPEGLATAQELCIQDHAAAKAIAAMIAASAPLATPAPLTDAPDAAALP